MSDSANTVSATMRRIDHLLDKHVKKNALPDCRVLERIGLTASQVRYLTSRMRPTEGK